MVLHKKTTVELVTPIHGMTVVTRTQSSPVAMVIASPIIGFAMGLMIMATLTGVPTVAMGPMRSSLRAAGAITLHMIIIFVMAAAVMPAWIRVALI